MQRIIYKNPDNSISILLPTDEAMNIYGIDAIAKKDTPTGLPYWIVSTDVIPTDRTDRNAWELDGSEGEPDGCGGESHEFEVTP